MFLSSKSVTSDPNQSILQQLRQKGATQIDYVCTFLVLQSIGSAIIEAHDGIYPESASIFQRTFWSAFCFTTNLTLKIAMRKNKEIIQFAPFIICFGGIINCTEREIFISPNQFKFAYPLIALIAMNDYFNVIVFSKWSYKTVSSLMMWTYYIVRNYQYYGMFPVDLFFGIVFLSLLNFKSGLITEQYILSIQQLYQNQAKFMDDVFQNTLKLIPNGIVLVDVDQSQIVYSNQEMDDIIGNDYTHSVISQLQTFKYYEKYNMKKYENNILMKRNILESASNTQESDKTTELTLWQYLLTLNETNQDKVFKSNSPKKFIQVKTALIHNLKQMIVICTDISRIKELQSTANKMKAMFFSSIAHELRTPLNSIIPMATIINQKSKDQQVKSYSQIIINSSLHLQSIIEDALDMSRIENKKFDIFNDFFDIRQTVQDVCQIMEFQTSQKKLFLTSNFTERVPLLINSDSKRFKQVLFNLIGNAIKFTFKGGITINIDFIDDFLVTEVQDSGIGMKETDINLLFQFFGQISKVKDINRGGMGLGLTISKLIIEQLNGEITVNSKENEGSIFTFRIFINDYQNNQQMTEENLGSFNDFCQSTRDINVLLTNYQNLEQMTYQTQMYQMPEQSQLELVLDNNQSQTKILIVDDSSYNLFVMKELLDDIEEHEFKIDTALNGQEAIDLIMDNRDLSNICTYGYIFLDLQMPVLDGFETIKQLRIKSSKKEINLDQTKIIAFSANSVSQFHQMIGHELFDMFIEKPINYETLENLFIK